MDINDVDYEELRSKTQELVEKMKLKQKGLSKSLQETLDIINSSQDAIFEKAAIVDKTMDNGLVRGQSRDILVRSFDLTQQGTAKQKLVALAKRQPPKNICKTPVCDSMSEKQDGDTPDVQLTDQTVLSDTSPQNADIGPACQNRTQFEHNSDDLNNFKVFESPVRSKADSAVVESLSGSEPETREKITPNSVKRRRIIDKNVKVHSGEILDRIEQEYDLGLGLNYSYSDIYSDTDSDSDSARDEVFVSDSSSFDDLESGKVVKGSEGLSEDMLPATSVPTNQRTKTSNYKDILSDPGNIKNTEKPILNRTTQKKSKLLTSRAALNNLCSNTQRLKSKEHKLLGYDWIASVLDNNGETSLEITDDHFDELRNFWKEQQGRPINDLNLLKKYVDDSEEPQLIQDILAESKIQSYRINNRLFPEPVRKKNISGKKDDLGIENRPPAFGSPRYVSVTVPNNTIKVNSTTRSHRRGSVDSSETLSLGKHCVLGWESSCVNVPPTGTTLSMKDATTIPKAKQVLTLEEAEELARGCGSRRPRQLARYFADKTNITDPSLPDDKKTSKSKRSDFLKRVMEATNPPENPGPNSSVRSTSELLDSAYTLMRDLDRIKQERKMKRLAKTEQGGIP